MDTKMIGNKIAQARKEMNMSQAQLAQLLFISPQAVGKWERGGPVVRHVPKGHVELSIRTRSVVGIHCTAAGK